MKKVNGQFLFLGTGGSMGVPVVGCNCSVCQSNSPFNKRLRSSGLLSILHKEVLIDCGPDFRMQMLREGIKHLDGLILTHAHYDHTGGFDEIRIINARSKAPIPCLLSTATADDLKLRFPYVFDTRDSMATITTKISSHILEDYRGYTEFLGIPIHYMTYEQGGMLVNGFRIGNFAYISDISHYPQTIFEDLRGIEILIVSCLREEPSHLHFNVDDAVSFSRQLGVKQAWFTHIAHEIDHALVNAKLPPNFQLAYDGLKVPFEFTLHPHKE